MITIYRFRLIVSFPTIETIPAIHDQRRGTAPRLKLAKFSSCKSQVKLHGKILLWSSGVRIHHYQWVICVQVICTRVRINMMPGLISYRTQKTIWIAEWIFCAQSLHCLATWHRSLLSSGYRHFSRAKDFISFGLWWPKIKPARTTVLGEGGTTVNGNGSILLMIINLRATSFHICLPTVMNIKQDALLRLRDITN